MRTQSREHPQCHGWIVESYSDTEGPDDSRPEVIGWRCVSCDERSISEFGWVAGSLSDIALNNYLH